jgi:photosynthetic reaction center cytochrome c subunit
MEMQLNCKRSAFAATRLVSVFALAVALMSAQPGAGPASPQGAAAGGAPRNADEVYKNIQVLKGVPADQLMPAMQFIAASLGVGCDFCHVARQPDKDDKKPKQAARKMMTMMFAINRDNFEGRRDVTCYSCHHGVPKPAVTPLIAEEKAMPPSSEPAPGDAMKSEPANPASLPPPDQILSDYIKALGGEAAVRTISSRIEKGTVTAFAGHKFPIEISAKAPNKQISVTHFPNGDNATVYDGHTGWLGFPGQPAHEMSSSDLYAAELDAGLSFPASLPQLFSGLKLERKEKVGGRETYVVSGSRPGQPPVELYFDQQSGLLVRQVRYAESPVGLYPTEIDYADYRDADGVKAPFRWITLRPAGSSIVQFDEVQENAPIDDARFTRPAPPAGAKSTTP